MINSYPDDEIEVILRGPKSRFLIGNDRHFPDYFYTSLPLSVPLSGVPVDYTVTLKSVQPGEITVKVIKTAKQKQLEANQKKIEALDQQIADLQARRAELRGVSYWLRGNGAYYKKTGDNGMQFFLSGEWKDAQYPDIDQYANPRLFNKVRFVDLPEEIKLRERDCE